MKLVWLNLQVNGCSEFVSLIGFQGVVSGLTFRVDFLILIKFEALLFEVVLINII